MPKLKVHKFNFKYGQKRQPDETNDVPGEIQFVFAAASLEEIAKNSGPSFESLHT